MSFAMMFLVLAAFVFSIFAFAAVLSYFLTKALPGKDALVVDTPEEALERKI